MQLVFLSLEMIEKASHAQELAFTLDDHATMLGIMFGPRDIERDIRLLGKALKFGEEGAIFGLGPGLDGAIVQGFRLIRYHQVKIEVDSVAEPLTTRAGAVWVIEGKQARLGLLVAKVAVLAVKALRKPELL